MKRRSKIDDILDGKHICHGTLGCPFTNYWIKKGIELEKAGYEQGKKEKEVEVIKSRQRGYDEGKANKEAYAKQKQIEILEKVLKWQKDYEDVSKDGVRGYIKEELKRLSK